MHTLLVTRNFPPLRGGMERLNEMLLGQLGRRGLASLVGPRGSRAFAPEGTPVRELPSGPLPLTIAAGIAAAVASALRSRPDIVLAGSGLMAPAALAAAGSVGALPAVYLHGLDIVVPHPLYRAAWLPCIRRCRRVLVNSLNTQRLAVAAGVDAGRIHVVHPGVASPVLDAGARARFRSRHGIGQDAPVLLSVGRLTRRKGLVEFVERCLPRIVAQQPRARLAIVGDEAADALHPGMGAGIGGVLAGARGANVAEAIDWLGPCSDQELAEAYQAADLLVFPVRDIPGDVEGFGMVAIEAAAHGLPTVAFGVGGVPDAVATGQNGQLVEAGDYVAFADAVLDALVHPDIRGRSEAARRFAGRFGWERFGDEAAHALGMPS